MRSPKEPTEIQIGSGSVTTNKTIIQNIKMIGDESEKAVSHQFPIGIRPDITAIKKFGFGLF
jgi:hypothetical protein